MDQPRIGNLNMVRINRFQNLLYTRFIIEKRYRVDEIAEKIGIHRDTLYRHIRGENQFPVDLIPNLVKATGDDFFLRYLAREAGYTIFKKCTDKKINETIKTLSEILFNVFDEEDAG